MSTYRNSGKRARNIAIKICVNAAEAELIRQRAGKVAIGPWLRELATGESDAMPAPRRSRIQDGERSLAPLAKSVALAGNNLSRIARALEPQGLMAEQVATALKELAEIRKELHCVVQNFLSRR